MKIYLITILASLFLVACIPAVQAQRTLVTDHLKANQKITLNGESRTKFNQFYSQTSAPTGTLHEGDIWYDTDDFLLWVHTGSAWEQVTTASSSPDSSVYATVYRTDTLSQNIRDEVAAAGYLTSEVDGSITNELQSADEVSSSAIGNVTAIHVQGAIRQLDSLISSGIISATSQYRGNATPATDPGTPTIPVFYTTAVAGTYTNFDALEVTETFAILAYDTTGAGAWQKSEVDVLGARASQIDSAYAYLYGIINDTTLTKNETWISDANAASLWGDYDMYVGDGRIPDSLYWVSANAGDLVVAYVTISGSIVTITDRDTVSSVVGTNAVLMEPDVWGSGYKTYVMCRPKSSGALTLRYRSTSGQNSYNCPINGGTLGASPTLDFSYWISFSRTTQSPKKPEIDEMLVDFPGVQADVAQLQSDVLALDVSTLLSPCETDHCLRSRLALYGYAELDTIVFVDTVILLQDNQEIQGFGQAELVVSGSLPGAIIQIEGDRAKVRGIKFTGTQTYSPSATTQINSQVNAADLNGIGTQVGILVDSSMFAHITECDFKKLDRGITGTHAVPSSSVITNCTFLENYIGLDFAQRWEYNSASNCTGYRNLISCRIQGGNNVVTNFNTRDDRIGLMWKGGDNDSHGSVSNSLFNHAYYIGVLAYGITNQASMSNCQIWLTATNDDIVTTSASKFFWSGGYISKNVTAGTTTALIANALFSNTSAVTGTISLKNNYRVDGTQTGVTN